MDALIGMLIKVVFLALGVLIKILAKLRLLPAFLFVLITQIWFGAWAHSLGYWYDVIGIGLAAIGLGSFVVQGILKLRDHLFSRRLEKAYEQRMEAEQEQALLDELYSNGRVTRINLYKKEQP